MWSSGLRRDAGRLADGIKYTDFGASEAVSEGLNTFASGAAQASEQTPQAFQLQGSPVGFVIYNATTEYLAGVMNGDLSMEEAVDKIKEELAENAN